MTRKENPLEELEKAYAQWESLYKQGGSDPFYPDGCPLPAKIDRKKVKKTE